MQNVNDLKYGTKWFENKYLLEKSQSEVYIEGIFICNVIEKIAEHGIHCFPCSDTKDVIDLLQYQQKVQIDVRVTSLRHLCQGTTHNNC